MKINGEKQAALEQKWRIGGERTGGNGVMPAAKAGGGRRQKTGSSLCENESENSEKPVAAS